MKFNMYFYIIKEEEERIRKKIRELQGGEQKEMKGGEKETYPYNLFKKSIDFIINIKNKNKDERTEVFKKLFAEDNKEVKKELELKQLDGNEEKKMEVREQDINQETKKIENKEETKELKVRELHDDEEINKMEVREPREIEKIEIEQGLKILKEIKRVK